MSPTVFRKRGYRFFFFSREETRPHIHVYSGDGEAKFWIEPTVELARHYRYTQRQLREIEGIVEEYRDVIRTAWRERFGG
ncbi:MAG: DUF4160 domain-containing protein [Gammaproteobacteria bacterium]